MGQDLRYLTLTIARATGLTALPLALLVIFIWDVPAGMSFLFGSLLSLLGFLLGVAALRHATRGSGQGRLLFPLALNFLKLAAAALSMVLLARCRPALAVFFVVGYSMILLGILRYAKGLK